MLLSSSSIGFTMLLCVGVVDAVADGGGGGQVRLLLIGQTFLLSFFRDLARHNIDGGVAAS